MNIQHTDSDSLKTQITLQVTAADYSPEIETRLKKYRRQANMPGFRTGHVPMGIIKKMYNSNVKMEVINELLSQNLTNYIQEKDLRVLGEPLPINQDENMDFTADHDYSFDFEVALAPDLKEMLVLNKRIKVTMNIPEVTEESIEAAIENYCSQHGQVKEQESIEAEDCLVIGALTQLDEKGEELEAGIKKQDALVSIKNIKDKKIKESILGTKKGEQITINLVKALENESEIAHLLGIEKDQVESLKDSNFSFTIDKITLFEKAERNQELYTKVFGKEKAADEEAFKACVVEELKAFNKSQAEYLLSHSIKEKLISKLEDVKFADDVLKRWLLFKDEKLTAEELDKSYPDMVSGFKWELIKNYIFETQDVKMEQKDFKQAAVEMTRMQFAQYGLPITDEKMLEAYAENMLKDQNMLSHIQSFAVENKVFSTIKELIKIDEKEVSKEEFEKLSQK